jgi:hypothetical protein
MIMRGGSDVQLAGQAKSPGWQKRQRSPTGAAKPVFPDGGSPKRPHLSCHDIRASGRRVCLEDLVAAAGKSQEWVDYVIRNVASESKEVFEYGTCVDVDSVVPYIMVSVLQGQVKIESQRVWEHKGDTYYALTLGLLAGGTEPVTSQGNARFANPFQHCLS